MQELVSLRLDGSNPKTTDQASNIILDQRFIKQHSTKRTLAELAAKHHSITESNFYHRQRKALLMAYNLIPTDQVKLIK